MVDVKTAQMLALAASVLTLPGVLMGQVSSGTPNSNSIIVPCIDTIAIPVFGDFKNGLVRQSTIRSHLEVPQAPDVYARFVLEHVSQNCGKTFQAELTKQDTGSTKIVFFLQIEQQGKVVPQRATLALSPKLLPCQSSLEFGLRGAEEGLGILAQFGDEPKPRNPVQPDTTNRSFVIPIRQGDCGKSFKLSSLDVIGTTYLGEYNIEQFSPVDFHPLARSLRIIQLGVAVIFLVLLVAAGLAFWWVRRTHAGPVYTVIGPDGEQSAGIEDHLFKIYRAMKTLSAKVGRVEELRNTMPTQSAEGGKSEEILEQRGTGQELAMAAAVHGQEPTRVDTPPVPEPGASRPGVTTRQFRPILNIDSFASWFNRTNWSDRYENSPWDLRATKVNFRDPEAMSKNPSTHEPLVPAMSGELMVFEGRDLNDRGYLTPALDLRRPWPKTPVKRWSRFFDFDGLEPSKLERPALVQLKGGRYELVEKGRLLD